jgi:ATPase subunit of ABC transporter with duplicated ATPase domains
MMNTLRNKVENSTSKLKDVHAEKIEGLKKELNHLNAALPATDKMKMGFDDAALHRGKMLVQAVDIDYFYGERPLLRNNLTFQIRSGERIALKGSNGSGKITLIKLLLGDIEPKRGELQRTHINVVYFDQDYSLLNNALNVYEQAQRFNTSALQEHEVKIRLTRFLFTSADWDKRCCDLSGGERMRLLLCCLTISNQSPDMIVLDEPTNNLDIQNLEILTAAVNQYQGTLILVSHDTTFLEQ